MSSNLPPASWPALPALDVTPTHAADFAAEARRIHAESIRYWTTYDTPAFFRRPAPEVWAPADHIRHLNKVLRAITRGLRVPRLLLLVRFGWSRRPSRTLDALRADYAAVLARGGTAGRYAASPLSAADATDDRRATVMAEHATAVEEFAEAIRRWSPRALDRYRVPHPLMGRLPMREIALFALLHNVHHVEVAERRRRQHAGQGEAAT